MKLSDNQLAHLRRLGLAVDELEFRCEALRRVTESTLEAMRSQRTRASDLAASIEDRHLTHGVASGDEPSIARLKQLAAERASVLRHAERLEHQLEESRAQLTGLISYFSPLRSRFERLMSRCHLSIDDLGIPHGQVVQRGRPADLISVGARS